MPDHCNNSIAFGSLVKCVTQFDEEKQGEVIAYDKKTKMLLLKHASTSQKPNTNNIILLNMDLIKKLDIVKRKRQPLQSLPSLNTAKLLERYEEEFSRKLCLAKARSDGVNEEGIFLYLLLKKVMPADTIKWSERDISVMDEVLIKPPYLVDNCVFAQPMIDNVQCLNHVKNIVKKYHSEKK